MVGPRRTLIPRRVFRSGLNNSHPNLSHSKTSIQQQMVTFKNGKLFVKQEDFKRFKNEIRKFWVDSGAAYHAKLNDELNVVPKDVGDFRVMVPLGMKEPDLVRELRSFRADVEVVLV